ncbi:MAG: hypothetical protein ACKO7B_11415, partial [Flavobacteriales bacterium]
TGFAISTTGVFTPSQVGNYLVKYIWKNGKTCESEKQVSIQVTEPETVEAGIDRSVCIDTIGFRLSGFSPKGGKWTGPGMNNSTDSSFNPRKAGVGVKTLLYTVGSGQCLRRDSLQVTVKSLPLVNAGPDQDTVCVNDAAFNLSTQTGVNPVSGGIWTGPGVSGTQFDPGTAGVGTHIITH